MASNIGDIDAGLPSRIKDEAGKLSPSDRLAAIASALAEYQKARPRWRVTALVGAGTYDYAIASLTGFEDGFSWIGRVEGPVQTQPSIPDEVPADRYAIVRTPSGVVFRFLDRNPSSSDTYWVTVACRHTLNADTSTVLAVDDEALMDLAGAYCADALAAFYTQSTDGSMQADTVDHTGKSDTYRSLASSLRAKYAAKVPTLMYTGPRWIERS